MNDLDFKFLEKKENKNLFFVAFIVILIGLYLGFLIFSAKGYMKVLELEENKQLLQKGVQNLKKENAILQKKYFELKDLEDN